MRILGRGRACHVLTHWLAPDKLEYPARQAVRGKTERERGAGRERWEISCCICLRPSSCHFRGLTSTVVDAGRPDGKARSAGRAVCAANASAQPSDRACAFNLRAWTGRGGVNRSDGLVHVLIEPAPVAELHVPAVQSVEKKPRQCSASKSQQLWRRFLTRAGNALVHDAAPMSLHVPWPQPAHVRTMARVHGVSMSAHEPRSRVDRLIASY